MYDVIDSKTIRVKCTTYGAMGAKFWVILVVLKRLTENINILLCEKKTKSHYNNNTFFSQTNLKWKHLKYT